MSDRLPNSYSTFPNSFPQGLPAQQAQYSPPQRPQQSPEMKPFEHVTKFVDENPESAEAATNALDAILRTYPSAPDMDDATIPPSFSFGNLPPTSQPEQQPGGGLMRVDVTNLSLPQQQIILALRNQVQQGNMTHQQALDRLAMMQASAQSFIQLSPSVPYANPQPSSTPSASQIPQPGAQQGSGPYKTLTDVPLPQLRALSLQLMHVVLEGEKNLQANGSGEGDFQRQQLRARIEVNEQRLRALHEVISMKIRASGDPTQQTVSANGLPSISLLAQINGAPPQQPPQITHPPSQLPIQLNKLPGLSEDRFNSNFMQFARSKGIRLSERDLIIDDRRINLWALHRTVFSRNGFDQVSTHDEWPVIGAALGFPPVGGEPGRPPRCGAVVAQRLQQLYNDVLRHFDQVYISSIVARLRNSQASGQVVPQPPQPQAQPYQPTEGDYQALLAGIKSNTSVMNTETMSILPRFSNASGAELEAHHVPQHVITFVEQNRENLQRAAQDQAGFRAGHNRTQQYFVPEPARSLEGATSHLEEEIGLAMSGLEI